MKIGLHPIRIRFKPAMAALYALLLVFDSFKPVFAGDKPASRVRQATANFSDMVRQEALLRAKGAPQTPVVHEHPPVPDLDLPLAPGETVLSAPPPPHSSIQAAPLAPSPATTASFQALDDNGAAIPPDTHGAVGDSHLMVTLNSQVRVQSRTGANLQTVSLATFWASLGHSDVFDPKVMYDPYNDRWIAVACADRRQVDSSVLIAVSQSSDPLANWSFFSIDGDATNTNWVDYPGVGFNANWIVVTMNMFSNLDDAFAGVNAYVFEKAKLYAGQNGHVSNSPLDLRVSGFPIGIAVPATTFDNSTTTPLYILSVHDAGLGQIRLSNISGSLASPTWSPGVAPINTGIGGWHSNISGSNSVFLMPQQGSSQGIEPNDHRMLSCIFRNNSIWGTHAIFLPSGAPTRSAVHWFQITTAGGIQQANKLDGGSSAGPHYSFPSLSVNSESDMLIGYTRGSSSQFASANYSFRFNTDTASTLRDDTVLKAGEASYVRMGGGSRNRWGDYSNTVVDPANDVGFWTIQEYAASPSGGQDKWGTWWGQVVPADLGLTFTADRSKVGTGQRFTYSAKVSNLGSKSFTGVKLTVTLPANTTLVSAGPNCTGTSTVECDLGTLTGSLASSGDVTIVISPTSAAVGTSITTSATISAIENDGHTANNSGSVTTKVNPITTVYPNPWRPGAGGDFDSASGPCGNGIVFEAPAGTTVRIYNMTGDLVRDYTISSADSTAPSDPNMNCKAWDGKNDSGTIIGSGIYLALIKSPSGSEEVRKIAIEK